MPGFYYYLPKISKERIVRGAVLDREVLEHAGLAEVLGDVTHSPRHAAASGTTRGPDGSEGTVLSINCKTERLPKVGYFPDRQTWQPIGSGTTAWLGWWNDAPPDPQSLERWQIVPGYLVTDARGNDWNIPVARSPQPDFPNGTLPQSFLFDDNGEPRGVLQPAYQWLWDLAGEVRQFYAADVEPSEDATPVEVEQYQKPNFAWLVKAARRILAVNYRLGTAELNALHGLGQEVLTQTTIHSICKATIDFEILCAAKKKPPVEESSTPAS